MAPPSSATTRTTRSSASACWRTISTPRPPTATACCWPPPSTPPATASTATRWSATGDSRRRSGSTAAERGREAHAATFVQPAAGEPAFHDLVAEQAEDAAAQEQRARVAVPVHAGGAARVGRDARVCLQLAELAQRQRVVP